MNTQLTYTDEQHRLDYSKHANRRASQRGVSKSTMRTLVRNGNVIRKQGLRYYYMTNNELKYFEKDLQDEMRNLVVLMAGDSDMVITCYKNESALKKIKHKSKRLAKRYVTYN
ncbi:MAG: hypothetical protein DRI86_08705 [Bacteroidetes bacterium]|nr:MAG: hypothetical protein DRI86_08705 [Bacteroidota bacterium]